MNALKTYLNSLPKSDQIEYALACGTTLAYLRKAIYVKVNFDGALARALDIKSNGKVCRSSLRPDIWPELINNNNNNT